MGEFLTLNNIVILMNIIISLESNVVGIIGNT